MTYLTDLKHTLEVASAHAESDNPLDALVGRAEVSVLRRFVVGYDLKDNPIEYAENIDGSWTNLLTEREYDADYIEFSFPEYFNCTCTPRDEVACPACKARTADKEMEF